MPSPFHSIRTVSALGILVVTSLFAADGVVIQLGDTLSELALEHGVTMAELIEWNDIDDPDLIVAGTSLVVSSPTPTGAVPERYVVQPGETLSEIAARFGTSTAQVAATNDIADPNLIYAGQSLDLTAGSATTTPQQPTRAAGSTYVVVPGDTLSEIAEELGVSTAALAGINSIDNRNLIRIGQTLVIPDGVTGVATPTTTTQSPTPTTTTQSPPPPTPTTTTQNSEPTRGIGPVLTPLFAHWSQVYGVPQDLLEAIAWQESDWRPGAVGPEGHLGIGQLSPATILFIEERLLGTNLDPLDPSDGIELAARFLRYLLDRSQSEREAVAAWNQGLSDVRDNGISTSAAAFADAVLEIRRQRS